MRIVRRVFRQIAGTPGADRPPCPKRAARVRNRCWGNCRYGRVHSNPRDRLHALAEYDTGECCAPEDQYYRSGHDDRFEPARCTDTPSISLAIICASTNRATPLEAARSATVLIKTGWSIGSGFIIDANCHVITNRHVVETDGARGKLPIPSRKIQGPRSDWRTPGSSYSRQSTRRRIYVARWKAVRARTWSRPSWTDTSYSCGESSRIFPHTWSRTSVNGSKRRVAPASRPCSWTVESSTRCTRNLPTLPTSLCSSCQSPVAPISPQGARWSWRKSDSEFVPRSETLPV